MQSVQDEQEVSGDTAYEATSPSGASDQGKPVDSSQKNDQTDWQALLQEKDQKLLYLYADFDNYKRRMVKERADLIKFGWESGARDFLGVLDNLTLALMHLPADTQDPSIKNLRVGLEMVHAQFVATLERQGVTAIDALGKPFDPNLHEAVSQQPSDQPEGLVLQELSKGYFLHGRLLRAARVVVSVKADQKGSV